MSWTWAAGAGTDTRGARGRGRRRRRRAYGCGRQTIEGRHNGLSGAGAGRRMWWMWFGWGAGIRIPTTPTGPESRRLPGQQGQRADRWGSPKGTWVRGGRRGGTPGATPHARDSRVRKALQRYGTGAAVAAGRAAGGGKCRKRERVRPTGLVLFERPQKIDPAWYFSKGLKNIDPDSPRARYERPLTDLPTEAAESPAGRHEAR